MTKTDDKNIFNKKRKILIKSLNPNKKMKFSVKQIDNIYKELNYKILKKMKFIFTTDTKSPRILLKLVNFLEEDIKLSKQELKDHKPITKNEQMIYSSIKISNLILKKNLEDLKKDIQNHGRNFNVERFINTQKKKLETDIIEESEEESNNEIESSISEDEEEKEKEKEENNKYIKEFEKMKYGKQNTTDICYNYFNNLNAEEKQHILNKMNEVEKYNYKEMPNYFKILNLDISMEEKYHILKKLKTAERSHDGTKLKNWIDKVFRIPFGVYKKEKKHKSIKQYLDKLNKQMNDVVLGHDNAKRQIIQIIGQEIKNPDSTGAVMGLWGPPGTGKTSLIKDGIAKVLNRPFEFISLGGATDASFLEGHSYTYEGSIPGRIAMALINSKCMNPVIYFDELDKISNTSKGNEIVNLLVHITDPSQNKRFTDKYFHGLTFDLSKVTFIFSFNDKNKINRILADRITMIETKYLMVNQKVKIAKDYLLPKILKDINLKNITIDDATIRYLITNYTLEGGVRRLKQLLYKLARELNIYNMSGLKLLNHRVNFPYVLTKAVINEILKDLNKIVYDKKNSENRVGLVNGLYAIPSYGVGGLLPIEATFFPSNNPFELKLTGSLENIIKESIEIAKTNAWNLTPRVVREKWLNKWKINKLGIHVHCPDGSTPKDGPSAGLAFTTVIYSLLNNKKINCNIALTGEINLQGDALKIGGLEEKMEGAKRAGIKLVLFPNSNQNDLEKIKKRNIELITDKFEAKPVNNIKEVLKLILIDNEISVNKWIHEM